MLRYFFLLTMQVSFLLSVAQDGQSLTGDKKDTVSFFNALTHGQVNGHSRLFYMSTDNEGPLSDYYAMALGGGLRYRTKLYKGFQFAIGGYYIRNLFSSDLINPDSLTGSTSRYEIGQFDQSELPVKNSLLGIEDFYLKYHFSKSFLLYGKQVINTPFINPQDGRMRPTAVKGIWLELNEMKNSKMELGWLTHISPRGTESWYKGASSIGIYPSGVAPSGSKSNYKNHISSKGIAIAGLTHKLKNGIRLQGWNHWIENISNTLLLQADGEFPIKNKKITGGIQYIRQWAVKYGGHDDPSKTYFLPGQPSVVFGISAGLKAGKTTAKLNYTRITRSGRFLFPREWGKEPLYTFLPRERNEGAGDVHAVMVNIRHHFAEPKIDASIGIGKYHLPDVKDFRLNKYGLPSYYQVNLDLKYSFNGPLEGLQVQLLYLYKRRSGNYYNDWKFIFNKVNMHHTSIVMNYNF